MHYVKRQLAIINSGQVHAESKSALSYLRRQHRRFTQYHDTPLAETERDALSTAPREYLCVIRARFVWGRRLTTRRQYIPGLEACDGSCHIVVRDFSAKPQFRLQHRRGEFYLVFPGPEILKRARHSAFDRIELGLDFPLRSVADQTQFYSARNLTR